jgi:hypothetical protein
MLSQGKYNGATIVTSSQASNLQDAELQAISNANGNFNTIQDVSFLQFNFVPLSDHMSFDFLFASNEYGTFQCGFSDVFAFILTDLTDGTPTNLNIALIPSTTIPVSVTNIRNNLYNPGCPSANVAFFGRYNPNDPAGSSINMIGETVVMTAEADVEPGHAYKIKLAIGDYSDTAFDSAVFLAAGSFDIGQPQLPEDLTIANGTALCPGAEYTLSVDAGDSDFIYEWEFNGEIIDGANEDTIVVTEPGSYTCNASFVSDPDCHLSDTIIIEYIPEIEVNDPGNITVCENPDGPTAIDLRQVEADMLAGLPNPWAYEFNYYASPEAIDAGTPVFPYGAYDDGENGDTIYVTVIDASSICYTVKTFTLEIIETPEVDEPADVEVCGSYELDDLTVGNYYTGPNGTGDQLDAGDIITETATLYVYAANAGTLDPSVECTDEHQFEVVITSPPALSDADPIVVCDDDFDGVVTFDLTGSVNQILAGQPGFTATVHLTEDDANAGIDPIDDITAFVSGTQIVYVRAFEADTPACYSIANISITVNSRPEIFAAIDYILCDDNGAGDGVEVFDLTTKTDEITGGNATYIVSYYESQADAEGALNPIAAPGTYTNTTPWTQEIFVRAETAEGCVETTSFTLVVNPLPAIVTPVEDTECESAVGSGEATFDLASQDAIITGNNADYIVEYYNSQAAAQAPDPAGLVDTAPYTTGTTTLYVRVTDSNTNCVSYGELNLEVVPVPVPGVATPLEVCEDDPAPVNIYIGTFDLTPAINEIVGAQSGLTVTVHHNLADAENNENAVGNTTAYNNIHAPGATPANPADGTQVVYVRLQQTGTECYAIGMIDIIVHPIPAIGELEPYELCDNNNSPDGIEVFDLTSMNDDVTNGVAGLTVTYYETQADAEGNTNPIPTPEAYENTLDPHQRTIYVRLDSAFGCYSTGSFQIIVNPLPVIEANLEPFAACEEKPWRSAVQSS